MDPKITTSIALCAGVEARVENLRNAAPLIIICRSIGDSRDRNLPQLCFFLLCRCTEEYRFKLNSAIKFYVHVICALILSYVSLEVAIS